MNIQSSLTSFLIIFVVFADVSTSSTLPCTDDELDEAQKSFRNCVDSAKAGIVARHASASPSDDETTEQEEKEDVPPLCDELVR